MANTRTLTSANAVILLSVAGLFDTPQRIQGFSADDVTDTEATQNKETSMGVDGRLSAGWAPAVVVQNITLQADSLSADFFENWAAAERAAKEAYFASGTILIPGAKRKYTLTRGVLYASPPTPALRKTLQPRRFTLHWESVTPAPL